MDSENIYCCQLCHSEFESEEDLSLHRCIEIKQEFQESKVLDIYNVGQNGNLDLSEEFLSSILKQVDNLCDEIQKGDPIIERAISVNQQIIDAVDSYRNQLTLIDSKNVEMGQDIWDDYDNLMESDTDYKPKIKNQAKKNKLLNADSITPTSKVDKVAKPKVSTDENPEHVEMGEDILDDNDDLMESDKNASDTDYKPKIKNKAKKNKFPNADSMTLTSKVDKVTNSKVSMGENPNYKGFRALIPFLRYKNDHEIFECTICNKTFEKKIDMFQHLKSTHDSEITQKIAATKKKSFSKEHIDKMMDIVKS